MHKPHIELSLYLRSELIILLTLLVACDSADTDRLLPTTPPVVATSTAVFATPTPAPATINITREDYEAALSKWQSQGIEEYAVEIGQIPHASDQEGSVIYYVRGEYWVALPMPWPTSGAIATPAIINKSDYPNPIASLFARIDRSLSFVESEGQAPYVYTVAFDPTLGYPSFYEEYCDEGPLHRFCGTDSYTRERVVRFEVLKRRQP
jgi:hypothetical protein